MGGGPRLRSQENTLEKQSKFWFRIKYETIDRDKGRWQWGTTNRWEGNQYNFEVVEQRVRGYLARADYRSVSIVVEVDTTHWAPVGSWEQVLQTVEGIPDYVGSQPPPEPKSKWLLTYWKATQPVQRVGLFDTEADAIEYGKRKFQDCHLQAMQFAVIDPS